MDWRLDQAFFRRLVELYALSLILAGAAAIYEVLGPGWGEFSTEFDALAERHFGRVGDAELAVFVSIGLGTLVWHLAALFGLRNFRRWARWSFWISLTIATLVLSMPGLAYPSWAGPSVSITTEVGTALFGAILLLSYSRDHGGLWFKSPLETLKETF